MVSNLNLDRRTFLWTALASSVRLDLTAAQSTVTRPAVSRAALDAFRDIDAFCRKYLRTQPKEIDPRFVTQVPVPIEWPPAAENR